MNSIVLVLLGCTVSRMFRSALASIELWSLRWDGYGVLSGVCWGWLGGLVDVGIGLQ